MKKERADERMREKLQVVEEVKEKSRKEKEERRKREGEERRKKVEEREKRKEEEAVLRKLSTLTYSSKPRC